MYITRSLANFAIFVLSFFSYYQATRPDGKPETLGLQILDEPAAKQSDPTGLL